jgi:hypothetical protein
MVTLSSAASVANSEVSLEAPQSLLPEALFFLSYTG